MSAINIAGLDKAAVLAALYNASKQQGMGFMHQRGAVGMSVDEAQRELDACKEHGPHFDYLHGRVMKISLDEDEMETRLYDRDNGQGAAERAIAKLRG